ncbi:MAG: cytochrome c biogenesis protein CcsA [Leptospirales bacterium]
MDNANKSVNSAIVYAWIAISALSWLVMAWMVFLWVPSDNLQGIAQRIFYYHVPTAWVSMLGFMIGFIYSILYLWKRDLKFDGSAAAYTITGWVFTTGVIITGPLWAKPIWGDFWNWGDQRLVTFFILWLAFAGYILLRTGIPDPHKRARFSAILNIIAALDVPLVYYAIQIWDTASHPKPITVYDMKMKITIYTSVFAFMSMFFLITYLYKRYLKTELMINEKRGSS